MIRVVIVEDEMLVRLGMRTIMEQSDQPIEVIGAFASAQEALAWFDTHTADVLVTDIRLPGMSGLEMVSALGPEHRCMCKLVLSCLNTFDYAREAYELGVDKYILKQELQEDELPGLVCRLYAAPASPMEARLLDREQPEGDATCLLAGTMLLRGSAAVGDSDVDLNMIAGLLGEIPGPYSLRRVGVHEGDGLYLLLSFAPGIEAAGLAREMDLFFATACRRLGNYVSGRLFLALSPAFVGEVGWEAAERTLQQAMPAAFYAEAPQLVWAEGLPPFAPDAPDLHWPMDKLLEEPERRAFSIYLQDYFAACRRANVLPDAVRVQAAAFLHRLDHLLRQRHGACLEDIHTGDLPANYIGIQRIAGCGLLRCWLEELVEAASTYGEEERRKQNRMAGVLEYLEQNYRQDITLDTLAGVFHISPAYLSSQFSQKTGQTFTRYLGGLRIKQAMELLAQSDLSIEQIALESGFRNSNYFFRLFKRTAGRTAGEYRRLHRKVPKT